MIKPLLAGNWKMHGTLAEAIVLTKRLVAELGDQTDTDVLVFPPFPHLFPIRELLRGSRIGLGAQNIYFQEKGPFTGEVSPTMVAELCEWVIIGHSERRHQFGETNYEVHQKLEAALAAQLTPILCVGETLEQRQTGEANNVIESQIRSALDGITKPLRIAVAYEPVWAIGTGMPATAEIANEIIGGPIAQTLNELLGDRSASAIPLLYGGSVTPANIVQFMELPTIHGALIGGSSLKPDEFTRIVHLTAKVKLGD
jgi:triosephosphate isomerase